MALISMPKTVEESVSVIENFYKVYHSIRYIGDLAIIRLNRGLTNSQLNTINREFSDLSTDGTYSLYDPHAIESDSDTYPEQYRLVFHFYKIRYGRLYQLILTLNTF